MVSAASTEIILRNNNSAIGYVAPKQTRTVESMQEWSRMLTDGHKHKWTERDPYIVPEAEAAKTWAGLFKTNDIVS